MAEFESVYENELKKIISNNTALLRRLCFLRKFSSQSYIAAGAIRNLVWSVLHRQAFDLEHIEIDVIFFDQHEINQNICQEIHAQLIQQFPKNEWDVVNQALVHTWYKKENDESICPYLSLNDALSTWPETATAIAVRLTENNEIEIIAPFGLSDLFELKLRWNDHLVSRDIFMQRITSKQFLQRWDKVKIVE